VSAADFTAGAGSTTQQTPSVPRTSRSPPMVAPTDSRRGKSGVVSSSAVIRSFGAAGSFPAFGNLTKAW
jgi:hypothetical protein